MFWRKRKQTDFNAEVEAHLELEVEHLKEQGMSNEEARTAARRAFGNVTQAQERFYESNRWVWWDQLVQDIRYGFRQLLRNPGFTIVAVLTLALGIGANTAIFSVVNAVLLRPLPYKDPARLVYVWSAEKARQIPKSTVSIPDFRDWQQQNQVFEGMAAMVGGNFNLSGGEEPVRVNGLITSASYFDVLAARPLLGRTFAPEEEQFGKHNVAVLSEALWKESFGADPKIVGRSITLNAQSYTVIGVMPASFSSVDRNSHVWVPPSLPPDAQTSRDNRFMRVIARLKPGVTMERAQSDMDTIARRLAQSYAEDKGVTAYLVPIETQLLGDVRPALLLLLGAVGLVLLIACANLANLLLARSALRYREFAIRRALGAGRLRLIRQLLTESLLLSSCGAALGVLLANWGMEPLRLLVAKEIPRAQEIGIDFRVLVFAVAMAIATGIAFGLIPALVSLRSQPGESMKEGGRGSVRGMRGRRVQDLLVVLETALAMVLLVGAGLLAGSFFRLLTVDPGFNPEKVLTFEVSLPSNKYREGPQRIAFFAQLLERIRPLPGVVSAGATLTMPLGGGGRYWTSMEIEGRQKALTREEVPIVAYFQVTPDYFQVMGIRLVKGRGFDERDNGDAPKVTIVSEALVRRFFPGEDPIGKHIVISTVPLEVIGVVGGTIIDDIKDPEKPEVFTPYAQGVSGASGSMVLAVRTHSDPLMLAGAVREQVRALDKNQSVAEIRTLQNIVGESLAAPRLNTLLLAAFASLAILLAAVGIYGLLSYSVAQGTRDIGIHIALGARQSQVLRRVVGHGMRLAGLGISAGLLASLGLTRLMTGLLFGVRPSDPATLAGVSLILAAVAALASYVPARRATKVDPMVALRYE